MGPDDCGQAFLESVEHYLLGLEFLSSGLCHSCETCQDNYDIDDVGLDEQGDNFDDLISSGAFFDEGRFSYSQCDSCGSTLGGNRYAAHGFSADSVDVDVHHMEWCVDCVQYHANGTIPEEWEG